MRVRGVVLVAPALLEDGVHLVVERLLDREERLRDRHVHHLLLHDGGVGEGQAVDAERVGENK